MGGLIAPFFLLSKNGTKFGTNV